MAERATLRILTGQPHSRALGSERRECECFAGSPVEWTLAARQLPAQANSRFDLRMRMKIRGKSRLHFHQLDEAVAIDTGIDFLYIAVRPPNIAGPDSSRRFGGRRVGIARSLRQLLLQMFMPAHGDFIGLRARDTLEGQQVIDV